MSVYEWRRAGSVRAVARFAQDEAGAATVDWAVMAGLGAALTVLLLLSVSSGTSLAATSLNTGLVRGAVPVPAGAPAPPPARDSLASTQSGHGSGQSAPAGGAPSAPGTAGAGAPGAGPPAAPGASEGAASSERTAGAGTDPAPQPAAGPPVGPGAEAAEARNGNGNGNGGGEARGDDREDGDRDEDDREDAREDKGEPGPACGAGRGNASDRAAAQTGNGPRAAPAATCPDRPRA